MVLFKNKREEREAYIKTKIAKAKGLSYDKLKKEVYFKKSSLIELKEQLKISHVSIAITILFSISTITMTWITLYNTITKNKMDVYGIIKELEIMGYEEKIKEINSYVDMVGGSVILLKWVINLSIFFILLSLGYIIYDKISKDNKIEKAGLMEIELDILVEELDNKKEIKSKIINAKKKA